MVPSLLLRTHGGLPIWLTAGVPCALAIAVHKRVGEMRGINVRPAAADVRANEEGDWLAETYRHPAYPRRDAENKGNQTL